MKIKIYMLLLLILSAAAWTEIVWVPAGASDKVSILQEGIIRISAPDASKAGVLSGLIQIPSDVDAILVEAYVAKTDARSLTLTVHDGDTGDTLGYWQNPLPIVTETHVAAVLSVSHNTSQIRLFAGTDNQVSTAEIRNIKWKPLRRSMRYKYGIYGALINGEWSKRQTFKATDSQLGAVVFRVRQLKDYFPDGPNLAVRLYKWQDNMAQSISQGPLAETIIPRGQIPGTLEGVTEELDLAATYISGSRELSVPLSAPMVSGETYVLELAVDGKCEPDQGFLSWCWLDGYPDGQLFDNNSTRGNNLDLQLEVYNAVY